MWRFAEAAVTKTLELRHVDSVTAQSFFKELMLAYATPRRTPPFCLSWRAAPVCFPPEVRSLEPIGNLQAVFF